MFNKYTQYALLSFLLSTVVLSQISDLYLWVPYMIVGVVVFGVQIVKEYKKKFNVTFILVWNSVLMTLYIAIIFLIPDFLEMIFYHVQGFYIIGLLFFVCSFVILGYSLYNLYDQYDTKGKTTTENILQDNEVSNRTLVSTLQPSGRSTNWAMKEFIEREGKK